MTTQKSSRLNQLKFSIAVVQREMGCTISSTKHDLNVLSEQRWHESIAEILQIATSTHNKPPSTTHEIPHLRPRRMRRMIDAKTVAICDMLLDKAVLELSTGAPVTVSAEVSRKIQAELLQVCNSAIVIIKIGKVCEILSKREQSKLEREMIAASPTSTAVGPKAADRAIVSTNPGTKTTKSDSSIPSGKGIIVSQISLPPAAPAMSPKLVPLFLPSNPDRNPTPEAKPSPYPTPDYGFFDITEAMDDLMLPESHTAASQGHGRRRTQSGGNDGSAKVMQSRNSGTGLPISRPVRKSSSGELESSKHSTRRTESI